MKRRFGVEVELHQPHVPYVETIKGAARAQGRYKKQTGGRGQFGDCQIEIEPIAGSRLRVRRRDRGGIIPQASPAVDKGIQEAMAHGDLAGAPVQGVRVRSSTARTTTWTRRRWRSSRRVDGFKTAYEKAQPMLLEPIMQVEVTVPDERWARSSAT